MAPINCAVLGFGMSAVVFHIPFILALPELYTLTAVLERSATSEKSAVRDAYGSKVKVYTKIEEVLEDESINTVFISTINDTHYDFCVNCLNAGKNVVIEKPITPTSEEAYELAALAKSKGLILAVYQNRRFDSDFLTVRELIKEGTFGELSEFQSNYDRYKNEKGLKLWKEISLPGSGAPYDLGSHLIDQITSLFGKPESVTGIVSNSRLIGASDVGDSFIIHLHYPATSREGRRLPLIATARGSILSLASPQLRFTIKGTEATLIKFGLDVQEDQLKKSASSAVSKPDFGIEPESLQATLYKLDGTTIKVPTLPGNYKSWFENVAQAINTQNQNSLLVKPEESALVIEIIELAIKSSNEGRTIKL